MHDTPPTAGLLLALLGSNIIHNGTGMVDDVGTDLDVRRWPAIQSEVKRMSDIEVRIDDLLSRMTLAEKVGQMVMPDISSVRPEDVQRYKLGSVLNGGNSFPGGDRNAPPSAYAALARAFRAASTDRSDGGVGIPLVWATDAVHGHGHVRGAVLFPHNIGLGAARNPALVERIGRETARLLRATGIQWDFAPCLAVARDLRWGRTYESLGGDPAVVRDLSGALVRGLQGDVKEGTFLDQFRVIATAKHFIGDGGTHNGRDRGDTILSEKELIRIHAQGYFKAIEAGVQTVMASFSTWNGSSIHGSKYLLTDVLKNRLGFDGLVVGDWNGHAFVEGCTEESCPQAINAGIDIIMVPDRWRQMLKNIKKQVLIGEIPMLRIDDAVRRILRVKMRAGLFQEDALSSLKKNENDLAALFGHKTIKDLAREAVRESLLLLRNENQVLPIKAGSRVLITGRGADNIPMQVGGWSVTWQNDDTTNDDFPHATSIKEGLRQTLEEVGGTVLDESMCSIQNCKCSGVDADVAVVAFGEQPYAEFKGDRNSSLEFRDERTRSLLQALKSCHLPVVAILLSGRPLYMGDFMSLSDAFIAAFLPGTEGKGIADLLIGDSAGKARYAFSGRLPISWPKSPDDYHQAKKEVDFSNRA